MDSIDREEFRDAVALLRGDIHGVHARLDMLNGRTRNTEQNLALLEQRVDIEKRARSKTREWLHRVTSGAAAAGAALFLERMLGGLLK